MILDFNIVYSLLSKFERAERCKKETPSTPIRLVREMLDKLPPEIWSDPSKTFLDPACSTGTFLLEIVRKLNIGLASQMPDQTERLKHILTKQVWGLERSPVPLLMTKAAFEKLFIDTTGIVGEVNIYHANALDGVEEIKDMKFDVVVGNPPYQAPQEADGKRGGGDLLWHKFVRIALEVTKSTGSICFVHPAGWRKPQSERSKYNDLFRVLTKENHMTYLSIHNTADGMKTFGAGTRYDWYVVNKGATGNTTVRDELGKVKELDLSNLEWLPNHSIELILKLLGSGSIIFSRSAYASDKGWTSPEKTGEFIHPCIHSTTKKVIRYYYSKRKDKGHFGIPKAIFGDSGINDVVIDTKGEYGMTQHAMAIPVKSQKDGELLREFLMSDEFKNILNACSWSNFQIDWRMFRDFKQGFWRAQNE